MSVSARECSPKSWRESPRGSGSAGVLQGDLLKIKSVNYLPTREGLINIDLYIKRYITMYKDELNIHIWHTYARS